MSTKLATTKDYLLFIDEGAEIQKGDLKICLNDNYISKYLSKQNIESDTKCSDCKKIIAYYPLTKEAEELDLLELPNPFEEDFWETVPVKWVKWNKKKPHWNGAVWLQFNGKNQGRGIVHNGKLISLEGDKVSEEFIKDYQDTFYWLLQETDKAAQSKQFSLENVEKAIEMAWEADSKDGIVDLNIVLSYGDNNDLRTKWTKEEIIQSLSTQQLPKEFILGEGNTIEEQVKNGHYVY